jgi:apolipoprotein N-acyltransferase
MGEQRMLVGEVHVFDPGQTVLVRWGDWVGRAGLGFLILLAAYSLLAARNAAQPAGAQQKALDENSAMVQDSLLPRGWRFAVVLLQLCAWAGLLWIGLAALSPDTAQGRPLAQMELFAALVLAPLLAAWSIRRAFAGSVPAAERQRILDRASVYARARALAPRSRLDHWAFKFLLFPLVPALPAFRLHQHIAYGDTFGEYYSFGLKAYLLALLIWWVSWAIGLVLVAAALRVLTEAASLLAAALHPQRAGEVRNAAETFGRVLFYAGVPAWLLLRILYA